MILHRSDLMAFEVLLQDQRSIMRFISSREYQRDRTLLGFILERLNGILLLAKLIPVARLKLFPSRRVMGEPLAQVCTRSDILQPQIHSGASLRQAARP